MRLVFSVILRVEISQASSIPLTRARVKVKIPETTIVFLLLLTSRIVVLNSELDHHNLSTEQLDVSLDGIKQSFSIATTIESNA